MGFLTVSPVDILAPTCLNCPAAKEMKKRKGRENGKKLKGEENEDKINKTDARETCIHFDQAYLQNVYAYCI